MNKAISLLLILALSLFALDELDYSLAQNWIICEPGKSGMTYDLIYVYPTLSANDNRVFLDRKDEKTMVKVRNFVKAQAGIAAADARIFAPFVRQLEYKEILKVADGVSKDEAMRKAFAVGVDDLKNAIRYYCRNYRSGRPFIFFGHSQGAMELYEVLRDEKEISTDNGFVAAYLIGCPRLMTATILADFSDRDIQPASGETDVGVIVVWNTQSADTVNSLFTCKGTFCINPLNWKTDETPADKDKNLGAFFYDYVNNTTKNVPNFCGAAIDAEKGALIVSLPSNSQWDARGFMGKGIFHMNDVWFFAENMRQNMLLRAKQLQNRKKTAQER